MGKIIKKTLKVGSKLTGGILGNVSDNFLGTDIGGAKAKQEKAQRLEAEKNQAALDAQLNAQLNANALGVQGADNVVQVEAGGSAADAATMSNNKKRRAVSVSSTLGI